MDAIDRLIMHHTQAGLPLTLEPYQTLAEQLGLNKQELMKRLQAMQDSGQIRRIAAVPNHYRLGYRYNGMTVWNVADERIDTLGQHVGQLSFVSHCYHRPRHLPDWPYNLFAMIHAKTAQEAEQHIQQIKIVLSDACQEYTVLYSTKILKKTGFRSV